MIFRSKAKNSIFLLITLLIYGSNAPMGQNSKKEILLPGYGITMSKKFEAITPPAHATSNDCFAVMKM